MEEKAQATTFYFTNFPEEVHPQELKHRFSRFGEIVDFFIPSKTNKFGKQFGFVRFRGVEDAELIEAKMKEV
ncbi:RNA-binding protein 25-like [Trifolium medium]|uniref:RNA-binding protein 25-like n=1 Tax=Trifolium medium TaxID=97028 RepID=A0A392SA45_9FABA|nr:RNA-binding protein 25-like [Trifolium medium]